MIANFTIDRDDFFALQSDAIETSKAYKKRKLLFVIIITMIAPVISWFKFESIPLAIFASMFSAFGGYLLYDLFTVLKFEMFYKNDEKILKHSFGLGNCELILSEEGLIKKFKDKKEESAKWSQVIKARQDEERYFLYITDLNAIVIKKTPDNMNTDEVKAYNDFITISLSKVGCSL